MNLKEKNESYKRLCAPCYNWIVWNSLVRSGSIVSLLEKQRIQVGGSLIIPSRWDGPLLRGAVGHFVSWPMEGQSSTSRSGWGHHRGPVSTGGGVSPAGENWIPLSVSRWITQSVRQWKILTPTIHRGWIAVQESLFISTSVSLLIMFDRQVLMWIL